MDKNRIEFILGEVEGLTRVDNGLYFMMPC